MSALHATTTRINTAPAVVTDFPADYWDCFQIDALPGCPPREWARRSLRGAETANRLFSRIVWQGLLGLDLEPPSAAGTFMGWQIRSDTASEFIVEADGSLMSGRMAFEVSDTDVVWTTMLHYHRPAGRVVWGVAGHVHRALVPGCLEGARNSVERAGCR